MALGNQPEVWQHASSLEIYNGLLGRVGLPPLYALKTIRHRAKTPCIMHGHGVWRFSNLFPHALSKHSKAKVVWSPRGMFSPWAWNYRSAIKRPVWRLIQKPALQRVDCFHATANSELEDIRRLNFKQPVAIIPNGVDIPDISKNRNKRNRVVFLSRIHEKKGVHILIPAWRAIQSAFPEWELHIAGKVTDHYGRKMISLVDELGAKRINFRGEVLGEDKQKMLASARLFVLPTFSENFGIAIAEAMAHGTPVITTTETPWTDLKQRESGWCIPPGEIALTNALRHSLSLPKEELDRMGLQGRKWMAESYSWKSATSMMAELYAWLLGFSNKPDYVFTYRS